MATITAAAGGGNWSATGTWVGGVVPTSADDVVLASTSGSVTLDANAPCRSFDCQASGNYAATFTHNGFTLSIGDVTAGAGNVAFRLSSTMTYTRLSSTASIFAFVSSSATQQTITFAGKANVGALTWSGSGSWIFSDSPNSGTAGTLTLAQGSVDFNSKTVVAGSMIISGASTKSLTLGTSAVTLSAAGGWQYTGSNLTFSGLSSTINLTAAQSFVGGSLAYGNLSITGTGAATISGSNSFVNLSRVGTGTADSTTMQTGATQTVTGTLTLTGSTQAANRMQVSSSTLGNSSAFSLSNAPTLTNIDLMDIVFTGAGAPYTGTSIGDGGGNSGVTPTAARTLYKIGTTSWNNTASWSSASGGVSAGVAPLAQDNIIFDNNSPTGTTINASARWLGKDITTTGWAGTLNFNTTGASFFGSATIGATTTLTATATAIFRGRGSHTITSAGKSWQIGLNVTSYGGTYTLQDDLTVVGPFTVSGGGFVANNKNVTCTQFSGTGTLIRSIDMGTGTWTLTGTGTVFSFGTLTNLTFSGASCAMVITDASATLKALSGQALLLGSLTVTGTAGAIINFANSNMSFNNLTVSPTETLQLAASGGIAVRGSLTTPGATAGAGVKFRSSAPGTRRPLVLSSRTELVGADIQDTYFQGPTMRVLSGTNRGNNYGCDFRKVGPLLAAV